jgi:hypothetical protein
MMWPSLRAILRRIFSTRSDDLPPRDPYAYVRVPKRGGPSRHTAVAVAEPEEDIFVRAVGERPK